MQTKQRHSLCLDTVERLATAKNGATWREFAQALGYDKSYAATLNKAARGESGAMTPNAENVLRARLGLAPVYHVEVLPCPDCGAAHTGRCHGKPVAQVVVLAADERIIRKGPKRKRKATKALRIPPDLWAALNAERQAAGVTWAEYIERMAIDARTLQAYSTKEAQGDAR